MTDFSINVLPPVENSSTLVKDVIVFLFCVFASGAIWFPLFLNYQIPAHCDSLLYGFPMFWALHDFLWGGESLLWRPEIFGGHPLFAEGQGAFLNPIVLVSALLPDPAIGYVFMMFLATLMSALGTYVLCRILSVGRFGSLFAGLGVIYSGYWLDASHNYTWTTTLAWIPWLMAACEYWLRLPNLRRASLVACTASAMFFGGYVHFSYGAVLFIGTVFISHFLLSRYGRFGQTSISFGRAFLSTGFACLLLTLALSVVQLLPLIELVGQSIRQSGIDLVFPNIPFERYLRGLTEFYVGADTFLGATPSVASAITLALVVWALVTIRTGPIISYLAASFLLGNLAIEYSSPLFKFIYDNNLLPGLHSFRLTAPFFSWFVLGVSVVSGCVVDKLYRNGFPSLLKSGEAQSSLFNRALSCLIVCLICSMLVFLNWREADGYAHVVFFVVWVCVTLLLTVWHKAKWISISCLIFYLVESALFKIPPFLPHDVKILSEPNTVATLKTEPNYQDYKIYTWSLSSIALVFSPPKEVGNYLKYRAVAESLAANTALQFNIRSLNGWTALMLRRRDLVDKVIQSELIDTADYQRPRLLDYLGIKYIVTNQSVDSTRLAPVAIGDDTGIAVRKNLNALPLIQYYPYAAFAPSAEAAINEIKNSASPLLVVESEDRLLDAFCQQSDFCELKSMDILSSGATAYQINVETQGGGWLFVADAWYPGWKATVNGEDRPLYAAQVLGKAVKLDSGHNSISLYFGPDSFEIGRVISCFALFISLGCFMFGSMDRRPRLSFHSPE